MKEIESLESIRQPWTLVIVYTVFYLAVFVAGLIGNVFVVLAVVLNTNLRSATDYLISSLALADLLIILFCLPTTLLNNLLTEWQLGAIGCKLSTFINSTTSCASIFTLVAVTADRYMAICHTLKYALWEARPVLYMISAIWMISAVLASPNLVLYDEILYDLLPPNGTLVARLCVSTQDDFLHFIIVNLVIAFLVPIVLISVSYALIFKRVTNHQSVALAVDARIRDERIKLRVAQMMLTVIVLFMFCWSPLYGLYCYFFMASNRDSPFFQFSSSVLRPIFQWLSLLSSSLNPLIYIAYSQKYRRAFHQLLLLPCRMHYQSFQQATRATFRLAPLHSTLRQTDEQGRQVFDASKYGRKVSLQHHYFQPHEYTNGLMRKLSEQTSHLGYNCANGAARKYSLSPGLSLRMEHSANNNGEKAPLKPARKPSNYKSSLVVSCPSSSGPSIVRENSEETQGEELTMQLFIGGLSSQRKMDSTQPDNERKRKSQVEDPKKSIAKMTSFSIQQSASPSSVVLLRLSPVVAHI